ncbi:Homeodomain-like protein [Hypoxylon trugodes]|uniref:Homeodomain-like protein n=1 Tax=Hypoxylon trugodes TaxID=326681 RepID=UPI0021934337|nr:Homeodomain-like protein [Hypoxylon trugodes]KAI1391281.1 Homeodomain-like protein [Hypoxylon trugodes]
MSSSEPEHRRGPWCKAEDDSLMSLIDAQGPLNWVRIASRIQTRSPKQCRERYHQNLKPSLNHGPITPEEGVLIERMVQNNGKRWAEIARALPNRSDNAVKNWWNGNQNRRKRMARKSTAAGYGNGYDHFSRYSGSDRSPSPPQPPSASFHTPSSYTTPSVYPLGSHDSGHFSVFNPHQQHHTQTVHYSGLSSPSTTSSGIEFLDLHPLSNSHPRPIHDTIQFPRRLPSLRIDVERSSESSATTQGPMLPTLEPPVFPTRDPNAIRLPSIREIYDDLSPLRTDVLLPPVRLTEQLPQLGPESSASKEKIEAARSLISISSLLTS